MFVHRTSFYTQLVIHHDYIVGTRAPVLYNARVYAVLGCLVRCYGSGVILHWAVMADTKVLELQYSNDTSTGVLYTCSGGQ